MISLKETESCPNQGYTWIEGLIDSLSALLDIFGDSGGLLLFGATLFIIILLALINAALPS